LRFLPTKLLPRGRAKLAMVFAVLQLIANAVAGNSTRPDAAHAKPQFQLPRSGISNDELGIVVNDNDPLSRAIGAYYQTARAIPESNVLHVRIPVDNVALSRQQTLSLITDIRAQTPSHVQAYALAWNRPYKADCMSMTSAVTLGFDEKYCSNHCSATTASPYFDASTTFPQTEYGLRPTMMNRWRGLVLPALSHYPIAIMS
jgi:hypothetical protein